MSLYIVVSNNKILSNHFVRSAASKKAEKESGKRKGAHVRVYHLVEGWSVK